MATVIRKKHGKSCLSRTEIFQLFELYHEEDVNVRVLGNEFELQPDVVYNILMGNIHTEERSEYLSQND